MYDIFVVLYFVIITLSSFVWHCQSYIIISLSQLLFDYLTALAIKASGHIRILNFRELLQLLQCQTDYTISLDYIFNAGT